MKKIYYEDVSAVLLFVNRDQESTKGWTDAAVMLCKLNKRL